uniref:RING-type domain-containing protein n=1 Tax=Glossina brevipalpis TaxID=37001 RepID=A0A1A9W7V6_9MUSC
MPTSSSSIMSTSSSSVSAILCSKCMENFKKDDEIYFTSCGHVFHLACLQNWRSTECPECRVEYRSTRKLLFSFDCTRDNLVKELQTKLKNKKIELMDLQAQYTKVQKELDELNVKISISRENRDNFLALQNQYIEVNEANELEQKIDHIGEALKKEISNSIQSIDNMKLQSLIDQRHAAQIAPSGGETNDNSADKQMQNLE